LSWARHPEKPLSFEVTTISFDVFLGSSGDGAPYEVQRPGIDTEKK